ncbi:MAG: hypothetical protein SGI77_18030 [Pirellulaceae bacterium]|nr:hypothetical protein [Pirellulaceae bacterium]
MIFGSVIPTLDAQEAAVDVPTAELSRDYPITKFWIASARSNARSSWESVPPEVISAAVLDINEQEIVYLRAGESTPIRIASIRLQAVEVPWSTDTAVKAHAAFIASDYKSAIDLAKAAIAEGKLPRWQQRILASEIAESLTALGQSLTACRVFISLCRESPSAMLYRSAPLNWTNQRPTPELIQQAQSWISSEQPPIARLLGASWLLLGNDSTSATAVLEELSRSKSAFLAPLATAQLWRSATPNQVIERSNDWIAVRDQMLMPLQLGPTITISHKLEKASRKEDALQEWLRVIGVFPTYLKEVHDARTSAIELLNSLGRVEEAKKLSLNHQSP